MFYVKTQLAPETSLQTEIHEDNVFTQCPRCGEEIAVNLAEIFGDVEVDLFGTSVYCEACSKALTGEDTP